MLKTLYLLPWLLGFFACSPSVEIPDNDRAAIQEIMDQQVRCWNQGDLSCFMAGYWSSDSLMFIGKNGITYGYDQTLARYQKTYPDREAMGKLAFDIITLERLAGDAYYMVGKWALDREIEDIGGHFTLLFRRINGKWVITKDHSS